MRSWFTFRHTPSSVPSKTQAYMPFAEERKARCAVFNVLDFKANGGKIEQVVV